MQQQQNSSHLAQQIEDALASRFPVFFVQVGSNDGVSGDPIHHLVTQHKEWQGILIEPVKHIFQRLRRAYPDAERFALENVAVAAEQGTAKFYYVSEEAAQAIPELPDWYDQLGSFSKQHILNHLDGALAPFIIEEEIVCVTLDQILRKHTVTKIDLLHIDAEGQDYQILSQFDFVRFRPAAVLVEHYHLAADEKKKLETLLQRFEYSLYDCGADYLAIYRAQ